VPESSQEGGEVAEIQDAPALAVEPRRVDWIELFFDLAMVTLVTELAHGLHGAPGPTEFLTFIALSIPVWWAWTNVMVCVNQLPPLPRRLVGLALVFATGTVAVMAVSVTETPDRLWAFALANAVLRFILLGLWIYRARGNGSNGVHLVRPLLYNGGTALVWIASVFVPVPFNFAFWAVAILAEVLMLRAGSQTATIYDAVDIAHGSERLGLFVMILIGESLLSVVTSLSEHWNGASAVAALLGFATICAIAWWFFVRGGNAIEHGLARLRQQGDNAGMLDTVMIFPYLIVASITMFAAGLSTAVAHPNASLPPGASVCLGGGLALFYLTNVIVMRRYRASWGLLVPWALPAVIVSLGVIAIAPVISATVALVIELIVSVLVLALASLVERTHGHDLAPING
jgi:low temperature requirement protein LtrA